MQFISEKDINELLRIFERPNVDEITNLDIQKVKNNISIKQIFDKQEILDQLNEGFEKIINSFNIVDDGACICVYNKYDKEQFEQYDSFEEWYYKFLENVEEEYEREPLVNTEYLLMHTHGNNAYINSKKQVKFEDKDIFYRISTKIYNENIINSSDANISSLNNENYNKSILAQYISRFEKNCKHNISPIMFCICSNELSLKLLKFYTDNIEQLVLEDINEQDEQIRISNQADEQGGLYNWEFPGANIVTMKFGWIKKSQAIKEEFDKSLLMKKGTPFDIIFRNVDRKHTLEVIGTAKVKQIDGEYNASIKLESCQISNGMNTEEVKIWFWKQGRQMITKITEKLKEYFIQEAERL